MGLIDVVISLAAAHGLHLSAEDVSLNEAGLDYRVVMARDTAGKRWVLRVPRRDDVSTGLASAACWPACTPSPPARRRPPG